MHRRHFLAAAATLPLARSWAAAPHGVVGKDARLHLVAADPLVLETPDALLAAGRVTPAASLFVRNHHGAKALCDMRSRPLDGALDIAGLVGKPTSVPLGKLGTLEQSEVEMVLQCSGNFRAEFSKLSPIKGTPWRKGGVGNVRFAGVRISTLFQSLGVTIDPVAHYLTAEGADQPEKQGQADYERSVPLDAALSRGLLALRLNGEAIPALHGGPLRLVIPGYYGCNQVKWLTRLRLEAVETVNEFQLPDYRTPKQLIRPGEAVKYTFANSDPNFDMRVNSRLLAPSDGTTIAAGRPMALRGVAWNDGAAHLTSVDVSLDRGRTWTAANLAPADGGPFAFREWSLERALPAGRHEVWVRATDALGRTQPLDGGLFWNPGGYAWNGVERASLMAM